MCVCVCLCVFDVSGYLALACVVLALPAGIFMIVGRWECSSSPFFLCYGPLYLIDMKDACMHGLEVK